MLATATASPPDEASARGLRRPRPLLLAWVIIVLANAVAQPIRAARDLVDTDYVYAFMTGARMLHQGTSCLYCRDVVRQARAGFLQTGAALQNDLYSNPPLAAWVIQPIALLPVDVSFAAFLALSIAAIAGAGVILATRILPGDVPLATRGVLVFLALATLPAMQALALVNWNGLLVLAVAGSAWAAVARRPVLAGGLASVLLVKPQTVWLVPVVLVVTLNWRPLVGFALGAASWLGSTLLLIGPGQLPAWAHNDLPAHSPEVHQTVGLPGIAAELAGSSSAGFGSAVILSVIVAATAWRFRDALRADLAVTIGLAVAASVLCSPHIWPEDVLLVAVPLVLWARWEILPPLALTAALSVAYVLDSALPLGGGHLEAIVLATVVVGLMRCLVRVQSGALPTRPAIPRLITV